MQGIYFIRKNGLYYRPNSEGYTANLKEAGVFYLHECQNLTYPNGPEGPRDGLSFEPWPDSQFMTFDYTNHEGKREVRHVLVRDIYLGSTEYYPNEQWLLKAYCLDRKAERFFAMSEVKNIGVCTRIVPKPGAAYDICVIPMKLNEDDEFEGCLTREAEVYNLHVREYLSGIFEGDFDIIFDHDFNKTHEALIVAYKLERNFLSAGVEVNVDLGAL